MSLSLLVSGREKKSGEEMHFYTYNPQAIKLDASRGVGGTVVEFQDFSLPPLHCGIAEEVWEGSMCSIEL